jgi:hypothetical protein
MPDDLAQTPLARFIPISKIDEAQRMVWGVASDESIDAEGEVLDYEATKAAVTRWAEWGNIREMHNPSAVGVATEIVLDDATRSLFIGVHVVDDAAWQKVRAGVYKGFSVGGKALKKILQSMNGRVIRRVVEYILNEISLVDRPANPSARFTLVKAVITKGAIDMAKLGKMDDEEMSPETEEEKVNGEGEETGEEMPPDSPTGKADEETGAEETPPPAMTPESVRELILAVLKDVGLVRETDEEAGAYQISQAVEVADLRKSIEGLAAAGELQKTAGKLAKLDGSLKALTGDLAKIAAFIDDLGDRLERVEKLPQGSGPVLREIGLFGRTAGDASEAVLKGLLAEASDPQVRQVISEQLVKLQIRSIHSSSQQGSNAAG